MRTVKLVILGVILYGGFSWYSNMAFSYFEEKMYCVFSKDNIVISLNAKNLYTCKTYIRYLEVQMKKVYSDILLIQQHIDKKEDLGYWNPLKTGKVTRLNAIQNMRLNILSHMKTFESNLFQKSKTYFLDSISDYQKKLRRSLLALNALSDSGSITYITLIQQQLAVIEEIAQSTTFPQLNTSIQRYVYLKQQLQGK